MARWRVLVVDDDESVRNVLWRSLERGGIEAHTAASAREALDLLGTLRPDLIVTDERMPGMSGTQFMRKVRAQSGGAPFLVITAYHHESDLVAEAINAGAVRVLCKPKDLDPPVFLEAVNDVLDRARVRRAHGESRSTPASTTESTTPLIGSAPAMHDVYERIGRFAGGDAHVLVMGETGTGKELVARKIHEFSTRSDGPFVACNCASYAEGIIESELFGHVKGSFTGAVTDRRGLFAEAAKGTLFLDEIGDTSLNFQTKLLRVLQERTYCQVGSHKPLPMRARIIAATHADLERFVEEGKFRADLFYRLNVETIRLPALRERLSDVPDLARHFAAEASKAAGRPPPVLPRETEELPMAYDWRGNVRELQNRITSAVAFANCGVIMPSDLELPNATPRRPGTVRPLSDVMLAHVENVLEYTRGNKARAAKLLKISRTRLDRLVTRKAGEVE